MHKRKVGTNSLCSEGGSDLTLSSAMGAVRREEEWRGKKKEENGTGEIARR